MTEVDGQATREALKNIANALDAAVRDALADTGRAGERSVKQTHWFKDQTGKLRRQTQFHLEGSNWGALVANTGYAAFIENGNRPSGLGKYIYPRKAHALRFTIGGTVIYARKVRAHGPLPFMKTAADVMRHSARGIFAEHLNKVINRYAKE